jgi:hypothetical protein
MLGITYIIHNDLFNWYAYWRSTVFLLANLSKSHICWYITLHFLNVSKTGGLLSLFFLLRLRDPSQLLRFIQMFTKPKHCVDTVQCHKVTLMAHTSQIWNKGAQKLSILGLFIINGVLLYTKLICPMMQYACYLVSGSLLHAGMSRSCKCYNPYVFALWFAHPGT